MPVSLADAKEDKKKYTRVKMMIWKCGTYSIIILAIALLIKLLYKSLLIIKVDQAVYGHFEKE